MLWLLVLGLLGCKCPGILPGVSPTSVWPLQVQHTISTVILQMIDPIYCIILFYLVNLLKFDPDNNNAINLSSIYFPNLFPTTFFFSLFPFFPLSLSLSLLLTFLSFLLLFLFLFFSSASPISAGGDEGEASATPEMKKCARQLGFCLRGFQTYF